VCVQGFSGGKRTHGRPKLKQKDNINIQFQEIGWGGIVLD
jgi:hypothetical protein